VQPESGEREKKEVKGDELVGDGVKAEMI